jgi:WD40 repeat protein
MSLNSKPRTLGPSSSNGDDDAEEKAGSPYEDGDDIEEDDEDEDDSPEDFASAFPITHEVTLRDHTKVVSALALDPSGARVASGSHDYECKLWDFGGMSAALKPFKSWEPAGSYYVSISS